MIKEIEYRKGSIIIDNDESLKLPENAIILETTYVLETSSESIYEIGSIDRIHLYKKGLELIDNFEQKRTDAGKLNNILEFFRNNGIPSVRGKIKTKITYLIPIKESSKTKGKYV